jgi:hypothetical protein
VAVPGRARFGLFFVAILREVRYVAYALGITGLIERLAVLPLLPSLTGLAFAARVALVSALVLPVGVLLGVFLPHGVERLKEQAPALVPWAWSMDLPLLSALPIYLAAGWLLPPPVLPREAQASSS